MIAATHLSTPREAAGMDLKTAILTRRGEHRPVVSPPQTDGTPDVRIRQVATGAPDAGPAPIR
jgi:hypothetical protein